jgi:hypothetical protein
VAVLVLLPNRKVKGLIFTIFKSLGLLLTTCVSLLVVYVDGTKSPSPAYLIVALMLFGCLSGTWMCV